MEDFIGLQGTGASLSILQGFFNAFARWMASKRLDSFSLLLVLNIGSSVCLLKVSAVYFCFWFEKKQNYVF